MTKDEKKLFNQQRLLICAADVVEGAEKTGDVGVNRFTVSPRLLDRLAVAIEKVRNQ